MIENSNINILTSTYSLFEIIFPAVRQLKDSNKTSTDVFTNRSMNSNDFQHQNNIFDLNVDAAKESSIVIPPTEQLDVQPKQLVQQQLQTQLAFESSPAPIRILVVDDSMMNRKLLSKMVQIHGTVEQAVDGVDAVQKVKESMVDGIKYHVIFMDFMMPKMDGPTATVEILKLGYQGKIYGATGNAMQHDIDFFMESGVQKVFLKPLDPDSIHSIFTK